jgi:hypothetical protein
MARTITPWNPKHPKSMCDAVGKRAKDHARTLSNEELDGYITSFCEGAEGLVEFLTQPRHKKIKFLKNAAKAGFVKEWNAKVKEAEDKAKVEKEKRAIYEGTNGDNNDE